MDLMFAIGGLDAPEKGYTHSPTPSLSQILKEIPDYEPAFIYIIDPGEPVKAFRWRDDTMRWVKIKR